MRLATVLSIALVGLSAALVAESHFGIKVPVSAEDDAVIMGTAEPLAEEPVTAPVEEQRTPQRRTARVERAPGSFVPQPMSEPQKREMAQAIAEANERASRSAEMIRQAKASQEYREMVELERREMGQKR